MRSPRPSVRLPAWLLLVAALLAACSGGDGSDGATPGPDDVALHKVTVAGDSISVGLGASLRERIGDDHDVKVIGEVGSGLARPDTFDWPERLERLAEEFPPEVLVLSLGSNDATDLRDEDGATAVHLSDDDGWDQEYSRRLAAAFDAFRDTDTTVVWVGHVRTEEDRVGLTNRHIHRLAVELADSRDWVQVEDLADLLGSGEAVAQECLTEDGLHLRTPCLDTAAEGLVPIVTPNTRG